MSIFIFWQSSLIYKIETSNLPIFEIYKIQIYRHQFYFATIKIIFTAEKHLKIFQSKCQNLSYGNDLHEIGFIEAIYLIIVRVS